MFCNTLMAQVLLEDVSVTLSFDFTFFRVVKATVIYMETHFKNIQQLLEKKRKIKNATNVSLLKQISLS